MLKVRKEIFLQKIIGVRFKPAGKIYYFDPVDYSIEKGDSVIVETAGGLECGEVVIGMRELPQAENPSGNVPNLRKVYRKATKADLARVIENHKNEREAFDICQEKILEHDLPMKLINVRYTFDVNKIVFYFTSEGRVDFRLLVRDLAYIFRTRIEMRQVGVREEAKAVGGVGCCGRKLCCTTFLGDFAQVSIRMAKEQNLSLNPTKISGICGRLLCCLKFESDYYHECYIENNPLYEPKPNDRVVVDDGEGRVVSVNVVRRTATVLLDTNRTVVASWEDIIPSDREIVTKIPKAKLDLPKNKNDDSKVAVESKAPENSTPLSRETKSDVKSAGNSKPNRGKIFNRSANSSTENKDLAEDKKTPWINRPRKPRRPKGKLQ